ncbi:hypothetical protein C8J57DRAFT_1707226 [Mycena rebaudengoi]|nr:hypothetical protein C8J57DRAFT_1707226 [Mycena rebaudengoi]
MSHTLSVASLYHYRPSHPSFPPPIPPIAQPPLCLRRRSSSRSLAALAASFPHFPFPSLRRLRLSFSPIASPSTPSPLLLPRLRTLSYPSAPSYPSCRPPLFSLLTLPPIPPPVAPSRPPYLLRPIFPRLPLTFRSLRALRSLRRTRAPPSSLPSFLSSLALPPPCLCSHAHLTNHPLLLGAMTMNMAALASCVVYLGNIHPEPARNSIRGGVLQRGRYMADIHIAFITCIDLSHVLHLLPGVGRPRLTLNNRRLKLGWGKDSRSHTAARCATSTPALSRTSQGKSSGPPTCALAMLAGAPSAPSRTLRPSADPGECRPIALLRFLKETYAFPPPRLVLYQGVSHMNCAFVNFTNVSDVTKATENRSKYAAHRAREGPVRESAWEGPVCGCTQGLGRWGRTASGNRA